MNPILDLNEELKKCKTIEDLTGSNGLLKRLLGGMIEKMLEAEMDEHLGYEKHSALGYGTGNSRNGKSSKKLISSQGPIEIEVPRDRNGEFMPEVVKKRQRDISSFDAKIISMYAKGMSVRDIQDHVKDIYGADISPTTVSNITDKVMDVAFEWQSRPLDPIWAIIYFDAVHFKVKEAGAVVSKASYTAYGVSLDGHREVLGIWVGENEGAAYWLSVFSELRQRGVKDILIACMDGLRGLPEALKQVYPQTEVQICVIHMIRASLKHIPYKNYKEFVADLKTVYQAISLEIAERQLDKLNEKWGSKYKHAIGTWKNNWASISTYFRFSPELRKIIYTSNAVEGLHRRIRKVTKSKSVFPSSQALFKMLFLAIDDIAKKGPIKCNGWKGIYTSLGTLFPNRFSYEDVV
jgi:putative transposase